MLFGLCVTSLPRTSWMLPLLLVLLALPAAVHAEDFTYITNNGGITITGYTGLGGGVSIPDRINGLPVIGIDDFAFGDCSSLISVTIPTTTTNIGSRAFDSCTNLLTITVDSANACYSSEDGVLFNRSRTTLIDCPEGKAGSYTVPSGVTNIGVLAFSYCVGLANITVGSNVTIIGERAFTHCTSLANFTVPNSVTSLGDGMFEYCASLSNVTMPNSVTTIGSGVFSFCTSLTEISIPNSVTTIGNGAFARCTSLASVTIPNSVTSLGDIAFTYCTNLTKVTISDSITKIGGWLFYNCSSLADITIPDTATSIGPAAFFGCTSLTSITIPNGLTSIGNKAFYACTNLAGVYFEGNAPVLGSDAFVLADNATVYYLPGTTGWGSTLGDRPTALWTLPNPLILNHGSTFGVSTNGFGFIISWATNIPVVVEACASPSKPSWSPVATNTLTAGTSYFSDPEWTNHPARFYRIHSP